MSIKKLFGNTNQNSNFLSGANQRNLFDAVESSKNVKEIHKKQHSLTIQKQILLVVKKLKKDRVYQKHLDLRQIINATFLRWTNKTICYSNG